MDGKWKYELHGYDEWYGDNYDTKEESIQAGVQEILDDDLDINEFRVGQIRTYIPYIDPEWLIDHMRENAYEECGEVSENWLDVNKEQTSMLEEIINQVFYEWLEKVNEVPEFGEMINIKEIKIKE